MILDDHLVVYLVIRSDELALVLLHLQMEQIDVQILAEVPVEVLLDQLVAPVDHLAIGSEA